MARKKRTSEAPADQAALDALVAGVRTPEQLEAVFRQLKQRMVQQVLQAELTEHLGYPPGGERAGANARNGTSPKTVLTDEGALPVAIPRDRAGTFTPQFVPKGVRRLPGFDAKVLSLYARGLTVRELQAHLEECYQVEVSPAVITAVTDAVLAEAAGWQQRALEPVYIAVALDGLRVKIRTAWCAEPGPGQLARPPRPSGSHPARCSGDLTGGPGTPQVGPRTSQVAPRDQ
jgi:transposase-like protein